MADKKEALDDAQILNIISQELSDASGGVESDFIDGNRQAALGAYLGQPLGNEVEGRSKVISTDVADAIEWIMPEVIKSFTQNNDVVTFDATSSGDEDQADLESQYVYDVLMKDNNGFLVLHQFFKDALMQKNGFIKVFYENEEEVSTESYTGLTEPELMLAEADGSIEIIAQSEREEEGIPVYDINVTRTKSTPSIRVVSVPPEEFRVNRMHNQVDLSTARFTAHVLLRSASDLMEEGYSEDSIAEMGGTDALDSDRDYRFSMQGETTVPNSTESNDSSLRLIEVQESFIHIDINQDGIAEYLKITTAGSNNSPTVILSIEDVDENPFISSTAILMSHKLFGLSIYDRLKEIQDQKTSLWRNILDNMYLQNNQRTIAIEGQVNLDDLLVSRPGGIIRTKRLDAVAPYATPSLSGDSYQMMGYLDKTASGRVGVSPDGSVTDNMIGDRVGSEGIEKMMNQKEELVGLMIRVFAETGIKPLCYMIRRQAIKHQDVIKDYKHRGNWVQINPATWGNRPHSTVRVGTGSGNRKQQSAAISQIMLLQEKMMANPSNTLVTEKQIFKAIDKLAKFNGLPGAGSYFLDPASEEGQANAEKVQQGNKQKQEQVMKEKQAELQFQQKIADAETSKAKTAEQNVMLKGQIEQSKNQLSSAKLRADHQISTLKAQLDEAEAVIKAEGDSAELEYKYWQSKEQFKVQREQIAVAASGKEQKESTDGK